MCLRHIEYGQVARLHLHVIIVRRESDFDTGSLDAI